MSLFDYFLKRKKSSANVARDRLTIMVAQERSQRNAPDYLPRMKQDIMDVIARYVNISSDQLDISLDRTEGCDVLEFNVVLPDSKK